MIDVDVVGVLHAMFLDTGAQTSYFQDESLATYPPMGVLQDFFPGMGDFETETHLLPVNLGPLAVELRCGSLPGLLGMTLAMAGVTGIVGNQALLGCTMTYFSRQDKVVFA